MFIISFSPQRSDEVLEISVDGDVLTINGEEFDFTPLGEGETLPVEALAGEFFAGDAERVEGAVRLTIRLPIGPKASEAARFPAPVEASAGTMELPA